MKEWIALLSGAVAFCVTTTTPYPHVTVTSWLCVSSCMSSRCETLAFGVLSQSQISIDMLLLFLQQGRHHKADSCSVRHCSCRFCSSILSVRMVNCSSSWMEAHVLAVFPTRSHALLTPVSWVWVLLCLQVQPLVREMQSNVEFTVRQGTTVTSMVNLYTYIQVGMHVVCEEVRKVHCHRSGDDKGWLGSKGYSNKLEQRGSDKGEWCSQCLVSRPCLL